VLVADLVIGAVGVIAVGIYKMIIVLGLTVQAFIFITFVDEKEVPSVKHLHIYVCPKPAAFIPIFD